LYGQERIVSKRQLSCLFILVSDHAIDNCTSDSIHQLNLCWVICCLVFDYHAIIVSRRWTTLYTYAKQRIL